MGSIAILCAQGPIVNEGMMGSRLDPTLMTIPLTDSGRSRNTGGASSSMDDKNVRDVFDAAVSWRKVNGNRVIWYQYSER
jgi:hypothetical protein